MFAVLDERLPLDVTDLVMGYIPSHELKSISRVYYSRRDRYGLMVPKIPFERTVWSSRYHNPDSPYGVVLYAASVINKPTIVASVSILQGLKFGQHVVCTHGLVNLLCGYDMLPGEFQYLSEHWNNQWFDMFMRVIKSQSIRELALSGIPDLFIRLMRLIALDSMPMLGGMLVNITQQLDDNDKFLDTVFLPFRECFMLIYDRCMYELDGAYGTELTKLKAYLGD